MTKLNKKGFSAVEGLLITVVIAVASFIAWYVWHNRANTHTSTIPSGAIQDDTAKTDTVTKTQSGKKSLKTSTSNSTTAQQTTPSTQSSSSSKTSTTPTISIVSPSNNATITGNSITYSCKYKTPAGFSKVGASTVDESGYDAHAGFSQGIQSAGCSQELDITYLTNGKYTVKFTVYDKAGKTASASRTFNVQH